MTKMDLSLSIPTKNKQGFIVHENRRIWKGTDNELYVKMEGKFVPLKTIFEKEGESA